MTQPEELRKDATRIVEMLNLACSGNASNSYVAYTLAAVGMLPATTPLAEVLMTLRSEEREKRLDALEALRHRVGIISSAHPRKTQHPTWEWSEESRADVRASGLQSSETLDQVFAVMTKDPDLAVRAYAFGTFGTLASADKPSGPNITCLDNASARSWWNNHRGDYSK